MKLFRRLLLILVLILVVLALAALGIGAVVVRRTFPQTNGQLKVVGLLQPVEILRDRQGIPHIFAQNQDDLFFAQGYVHAQDRLWQMEFNRRVASGTLSEIIGKTTLDTDRFLRTWGLRRAAQLDWEIMDVNSKRILEAYARGVNAFINDHQDGLPLEFKILGFKPRPWEPVDSLAWGKVMAFNLSGNWEDELMRSKLVAKLPAESVEKLLPGYLPNGPLIVPRQVAEVAANVSLANIDPVRRLLSMEGESIGSNNWVISGNKSTTGHPLLANDPHLGLNIPSIWYENGLNAGELDVVGFSLPGTPGVVIGHNARIAWGVTNLDPDVQDLYIEKPNPQNPDQFEFQGKWEDAKIIDEQIAIKGAATETLRVKVTRHGPILNDVEKGLAQPTALKWTALEGGTLFQSLLMLDQAQDWQSFREALRYWSVPSQNFVFADVDGNIGYQAPGNIPIRAKGHGSVPVPGWTGEYEWTGYIPFDELPSAFNPSQGYIVSANNRVVLGDYKYFLGDDWAAPFRAQRITQLLEGSPKLGIEDMRHMQGDVQSLPADYIVPILLHLTPQDAVENQSLEIMRNWDKRMDASSSAAALFDVFVEHLLEAMVADELGSDLFKDYKGNGNKWMMALTLLVDKPDDPMWDDVKTLQKETREDIFRSAFTASVVFLKQQQGNQPAQWQWGRLHTMTFVHQPLGQSGIQLLEVMFNRGPIAARGSGFTIDAASYSHNAPYVMRSGASMRMILNPIDWDSSIAINTTGASGQPFNPHYDDMIAQWQGVDYHPLYFSHDKVTANSSERLILTP